MILQCQRFAVGALLLVGVVVVVDVTAWTPNHPRPQQKRPAQSSFLVDVKPVQWIASGMVAASLVFSPLPSFADNTATAAADAPTKVQVDVETNTLIKSIQDNKGELNAAVSNVVKETPSSDIKLDPPENKAAAVKEALKVGKEKETASVTAAAAPKEEAKPAVVVATPPSAEVKKVEAKPAEEKKPEAPKVDEKKPEAPKVEEKKTDAPKAEEKKPEAPKAEEKKPEAPKAEEKKPEAPKPEEKKPEAPKLEEKKPEAPKVEEKKVEAAPKAEEKKSEAPKVEEKKSEAPKVEEKKSEAPKVEEKKSEAPKVEEKKVEAPKAEEKKPEPPKPEAKKEEVKPPVAQSPKPAVEAPKPPQGASKPTPAKSAEKEEAQKLKEMLNDSVFNYKKEASTDGFKKKSDEVPFLDRPLIRTTVPAADGSGDVKLVFSNGQVAGGLIAAAGVSYLATYSYFNSELSEEDRLARERKEAIAAKRARLPAASSARPAASRGPTPPPSRPSGGPKKPPAATSVGSYLDALSGPDPSVPRDGRATNGANRPRRPTKKTPPKKPAKTQSYVDSLERNDAFADSLQNTRGPTNYLDSL